MGQRNFSVGQASVVRKVGERESTIPPAGGETLFSLHRRGEGSRDRADGRKSRRARSGERRQPVAARGELLAIAAGLLGASLLLAAGLLGASLVLAITWLIPEEGA